MNGFLYVIELSTGVVKVGRSDRPNHRIIAHAHEAAKYGVHVVRQWVSIEHGDCDASERNAISGCQVVGTLRSGREYFEIGFDQAVAIAAAAVRKAPPTRHGAVAASSEPTADLSDRIMDAIAAKEYTSKSEIRAAIGCGMKPLLDTLTSLKRSGRIVKHGRRGPYRAAA